MSPQGTAPALQPAGSIFDAPPDHPVPILREWLDCAIQSRVQEPGALALATAAADGRPSNRMVQLLEIKEDQLIFTTHADSQKGRQIATTGWAAGVLYWRETKQQIIVCGRVAPLPAHESNALWAQRPVQAHAMSVASHQSAILQDEQELRGRAQELIRSGAALARPEGWHGYALRASIIEFWQAGADRLHRRLRYEATPTGWTKHRLQP